MAFETDWPCHKKSKEFWCDRDGPGGFMGHTCATDELGFPFVTPVPLPTPYEAELLDILIEECAEVIQRATKIKRFGATEIEPGQGLDNATRLALEIADLEAVVDLLSKPKDFELGCGIIDCTTIFKNKGPKFQKLTRFMQHMPDDLRTKIREFVTGRARP